MYITSERERERERKREGGGIKQSGRVQTRYLIIW